MGKFKIHIKYKEKDFEAIEYAIINGEVEPLNDNSIKQVAIEMVNSWKEIKEQLNSIDEINYSIELIDN